MPGSGGWLDGEYEPLGAYRAAVGGAKLCGIHRFVVGERGVEPRLDDRLGITWPHNGLRHSFISYRIAQVQRSQQVVLEAGKLF